MKTDNKISLDGAWDFQVAIGTDLSKPASQAWRSAIVPMPWQAQFDDLRLSSGTAWYRRNISVSPESLQQVAKTAAILHFGAVDYMSTVWINGVQIGEHEGGYLPFEFEISRLLRVGENELLVRVIDSTDDHQQYPEYPFSEVPHGKQSWYGPLGGIWQSVWLEFRSRLHISHLSLNPVPATATVGVQVTLSEPTAADCQVLCSITNPEGKTVGTVTLDKGQKGIIQLENSPELWSPDSPNLYTVSASLSTTNGSTLHTVQKTCGFRTVEAREGRIYLNGEPIYLRGVLDQGYFPETIYTPNSLSLLEAQATSAKNLGFNCLRIHIKVEDPRYYEVADRLGLLVWTEIPNVALLTDESIERAHQTFSGMLERDDHHPAIIAWTLINENWGTDLSRNPAHRQWLADFYHTAKKMDPTRLVIDNSACGGNSHVAGDLEDYHEYRAIPDHAHNWDNWVAEFAGRSSDWVWYPDFRHNRRPDLPLIVSEFGNWGLPDPQTILEQGKEPWWFETGFEWNSGIVYPHGIINRYEASGLADLFPSYAEFAKHSQEHMAHSLHYEISSMRLANPIAGYIITEFTDVHWECNGMLTMQREPKYMLDPLLKNVNQDKVVLLRPTKWSGKPGSTFEVKVECMGISGQSANGTINWRIAEQSGNLPTPGGLIEFVLPLAGQFTLFAKWLNQAGETQAANQVNLVCVETKSTGKKLRVIENPALAESLKKLGYQLSEGDAAGAAWDEIVLTTAYNFEIKNHLHNGGQVIFLADPTNALENASASINPPVGQIALRAGTSWQGDWANSFSWIKKQGAFSHLPGSPLLEIEWASVMPDAVIVGLPSWVLQSHSWAGLALGWVHKVVSLLTVLPYGRGQILTTTFKLNPTTLTNDAMAQALFAGMLNLL